MTRPFHWAPDVVATLNQRRSNVVSSRPLEKIHHCGETVETVEVACSARGRVPNYVSEGQCHPRFSSPYLKICPRFDYISDI